MAPTLFGISDPSPFIRLSLSIVVLAIAVVGGRRLADLASRVPSYHGHVSRHGNQDHLSLAPSEKEGNLSRIMGGVTFACVGLLGARRHSAHLVLRSDCWARWSVLSTLGQFLAYLALRVVGSLLVFACMLGFGRLFQRVIEVRLIHAHISRNLVLLAGRLAYISSLVVGAIVILAIWGTGVVLPVALVGALTVALTLALQDVLRNLVSGSLSLAGASLCHWRPYFPRALHRTGSKIYRSGTPRSAPRTIERVLIPNSMLFTSAVVNLSAYDVNRGVVLVTVSDGGEAGLAGGRSRRFQPAFERSRRYARIRAPQIIVSGTAAGQAAVAGQCSGCPPKISRWWRTSIRRSSPRCTPG